MSKPKRILTLFLAFILFKIKIKDMLKMTFFDPVGKKLLIIKHFSV